MRGINQARTKVGDLTDGEKRVFIHVGFDRHTAAAHLGKLSDGKFHSGVDGIAAKYAVSIPVAKDQAECCGECKSAPLAPMPEYSPLLTEDRNEIDYKKAPKVDTK